MTDKICDTCHSRPHSDTCPMRDDALRARVVLLESVLHRIADVAERYQENKANQACAGLANCYRFARAALE